jgi:sigma-B regulation protein RsbQ
MDDVLHRNNVHISGSGPATMVFAHGFGCDQSTWKFITPAFAMDYRTVLFDYVGSGRSDKRAYSSRRYRTLDGYAQDLLDVLAALDLTDVIYVSHSVSGMIGTMAALREPHRFARMVMIAPSPRYLNDAGYFGGLTEADLDSLVSMMEHNYQGWANYLAPLVMGNQGSPEYTRMLEESFANNDPVIAREFALATFRVDARELLPRLDKPVLLLQCTDDASVPMSVAEYLLRHFPHARLEVLKATGHYPQISNPAQTAATIRRYLRENGLP